MSNAAMGVIERLKALSKVGFGYDLKPEDREALTAAVAALSASPAGVVKPQCCMCGKKGLSTVEGDGGTECELTDGRWVCSAECWDRAIESAGVGVETPSPSTHVEPDFRAHLWIQADENERLRTENEKLREIISHCAASLGNGAAIMPTCTVEFMAELPREIELVTSGLRSELSTAYRRGREDMREEAAKVAECHSDDRLGRDRHFEWNDGYIDGCRGAAAAIRKLEA